MSTPHRAPHRRIPDPNLFSTIVHRLALLNALEGLRSHGRRCHCRDCGGWRRFVAAAGKAVRS